MTRKIALTSTGPLSGNSTLSAHLRDNYNFIVADHSRTLVQAFVDNRNNGFSYCDWITVKQVYADKEFWRQQLQTFGYQVGYNDPGRSRVWVTRTLEDWMVFNRERDVVFDSFRGEVQAQVLRDRGFELVQLEINEDERILRALDAGVNYEKIMLAMTVAPALELGIRSPDITLDGSLPIDVQARILMHREEKRDGLHVFGSHMKG